MNASDVISDLKQESNATRAQLLARYFKTGKGEYAEGDVFWGLTVPIVRKTAKSYRLLPFTEIEILLHHPVHEVRLCGLLLLVEQAKQDPQAAAVLYLRNTPSINNWDLVDLSAGYIVGPIIPDADLSLLESLASSPILWERRIAIISTSYFIKQKKSEPTIVISKLLLHDQHDLIHKAVGWMLREVGKQCSLETEYAFLDQYATSMPRTMLRYAIERFDEPKRQYYLHLK